MPFSRWILGAVLVLAALGSVPLLHSIAQAPQPAVPSPDSGPPSATTVPLPLPKPSQAPPIPGAPPAWLQPGDPFGIEVTLESKTVASISGDANWENAFETLLNAFKTIDGYLDKQKIAPSGQRLIIYTQADDTGFHYQAAVPVADPPKIPPRGRLTIAQSPGGKMLKFIHRGSYDAMDATYEAITTYLDDKRIETQDMFIEEYVTDPLKAPPDQLVVMIYAPLKPPPPP